MNGIHDLGGKHGHGRVKPEAEEPAFHARWEAAVFAMMFATGRAGATGNSDRFRHAIERIDPIAYLGHTYYGRWLGGLETLLVESGVIDRDALTARAMELGAGPHDRIASRPAAVPDVVPTAAESRCFRPGAAKLRFGVGDRVRTHRETVAGHCRLPDYARDRVGAVVTCHDCWVFPDTNAHGRGECPTPLYTIAFEGTALWGDDAEPGTRVHLDLFEPYLEPFDG